MATGVGEILRRLRQSHVKDEETTPGEAQKGRPQGARRRSDRNTSSTQPEPGQTLSVFEQCGNYIERLPSEIILKICSFLDAFSLLNIGFVNKRFHDLANSNALWSVLYASQIKKKKWRPKGSMMTGALSSTSVEEKPAGYWKKLLLKEMAGYNDTMWKTELRHMNPHTGMPALTEQVIRRLHIQWEITLINKDGRESVYKQTHTFFEDSSVTVYWNCGFWPNMSSLIGLQIHGMCPALPASRDKPRWRSLIQKTSLNKSVHWSFLGADKLVKLLRFNNGILVGVWRGNWKIAFVMINLHFHKLIERSLLGSTFCPYIPTEDTALDSDSGQHGYTLHIVLHNPLQRIMCQRFSPLYITRVPNQMDYVQLIAIDLADVPQHKPVAKISVPWEAEGLRGNVERCCMMTLTVLDEAQRPFWCVGSPVKMSNKLRVVDLEYAGEQFVIKYEDVDGKVKMTFVWMEDLQQCFLVQLITAFPAAKVKKHFGRKS
ncbi:F-box only protein 15 [Pimephales promelas]|uniref:F-box only protein 15 n=1 Tax=Pimephales promelas TaxID=90988 RepID=UPI001955D74F|nr:F-box only protein 15 [Pimephales promelas]